MGVDASVLHARSLSGDSIFGFLIRGDVGVLLCSCLFLGRSGGWDTEPDPQYHTEQRVKSGETRSVNSHVFEYLQQQHNPHLLARHPHAYSNRPPPPSLRHSNAHTPPEIAASPSPSFPGIGIHKLELIPCPGFLKLSDIRRRGTKTVGRKSRSPGSVQVQLIGLRARERRPVRGC